MQLPATIPGLRLLTALLALYGVVWIALEGNLPQTLLLGLWAALVAAGHLLQRRLGGRRLRLAQWLLLAAAVGLLLGGGGGLFTLFFMALKTGLHAHGPEFSPGQIAWVAGRIPLWLAAGGLAGLGAGLLLAGRGR